MVKMEQRVIKIQLSWEKLQTLERTLAILETMLWTKKLKNQSNNIKVHFSSNTGGKSNGKFNVY
jgi:hypothetical protein